MKLTSEGKESSSSSPLQGMELAQCRQEFEQFTYRLAHDLHAPLRYIVSFGSMLEKSAEARLNDAEKKDVAGIINAGKRAQQLLETMLRYSQLLSAKPSYTAIDGKAFMERVASSFTNNKQAAKVKLTIKPIAKFYGDEKLLEQLFQHLLDNALKFSNPSNPLELTISATAKGGHYEFSIQDNGIGIAPRHHTRVFEMFSKLHPDDVYPGIGAGLAFSQKIVELHGGVLKVESEVGDGARFVFTLPDMRKSEI